MAKRRKSDLAIFEQLSPNKTSPRNKKIRRITPHSMAGNYTVEAMLSLNNFINPKGEGTPPTTNPSSVNYAIGSNGEIGLGLEEINRSIISSSAANDHEAITIEIANITGKPDWQMSDEAINSWLNLCVDICKFYGYKKLVYQEKPDHITGSAAIESWISSWANSGEMIISLHSWYSPKKDCPGPYFMRQLPWLVREINKRLSGLGSEKFIGENQSDPIDKDLITTLRDMSQDFDRLNQSIIANFDSTSISYGDETSKSEETIELTTKSEEEILFNDRYGDPNSWFVNAHDTYEKLDAKYRDEEFVEYQVRIKVPSVNVRNEPGINSAVNQIIRNNTIHTIIEERDGQIDSTGRLSTWGRLKTGTGWIALDFTTKV